jgi:integrase
LRADGLRLLGGTLGNACTMQGTAIKIKQAQDLAQGEHHLHSNGVRSMGRPSREDIVHGNTHVVHYMGEPIRKLRRAWASVGDGKDGPHVVRHTAATWLTQAGVDAFVAAGYLGMSVERLLEVYGHHHPASSANLHRVG